MAEAKDVQQYLAYWFQAGKNVMLDGGCKAYRPSTVIQGDRYSDEFLKCWNYLLSKNSGDCFLEGTHQTVQELLSSSWDITSCARCEMPVPMVAIGVNPLGCPCNDLPTWPNSDVPQPRSPISSRDRLFQIHNRLTQHDAAEDNDSHDSDCPQTSASLGSKAKR